eukprot:350760-Chlamydomonas_euryale.AAC.3
MLALNNKIQGVGFLDELCTRLALSGAVLLAYHDKARAAPGNDTSPQLSQINATPILSWPAAQSSNRKHFPYCLWIGTHPCQEMVIQALTAAGQRHSAPPAGKLKQRMLTERQVCTQARGPSMPSGRKLAEEA